MELNSEKPKRVEQELLNTLNSSERDQFKLKSNTEEIQQEQIEGTPFKIIGNNEKGYFLAFGPYKITENQPTITDTKELLESRMWDIIANLVITIVETLNKKNGVN